MEEKKFMATSNKVRLVAFYNELAIEVYSSALWNNLTWIQQMFVFDTNSGNNKEKLQIKK